MDNKPVYKRVLIKVSGEALAGKPEGGKGRGFGLSQDMLTDVAKHIALIHEMGVEVAIVVGGGNFWRGAQSKSMDRTRADHMGMLATVMNSLALADALEQQNEELRRQNEVLLRQNEELASRKMLFSPDRQPAAEDSPFREKAMDVVRSLYKNPDLDVNTFCQAMGVSKTLLNNKLQDAFGQSIGHFIRAYRLAVAKEMLENGSDATVAEIAYEVGFNDPKYFTRCFTKEYGVAPSSVGRKG